MKRAYIEITNVCNLSCQFCRKNRRPARFLSYDEFSYILTQLKPYTNRIFLHVQGEPLMHPELDRFLDLCDRDGWQVSLVTNGTFLSGWPSLLSHQSLYKVSFSLQSVEYQNPAILDSYLKQIFSFCKAASAGKQPYCEIRFWRADQMDLPATSYALRTIREEFHVEQFSSETTALIPYVRLAFDHSFTWPKETETEKGTRGTCLGGRNQIAVLSDGTVVPCCLDADGVIRLGNLFEQPLSEILQSKRFTELVTGFRRHFLSESFCRKCTFRNQFD